MARRPSFDFQLYGQTLIRLTTFSLMLLHLCFSFVIKNFIDNHQGDLFCRFIDLKAANDWINRETLFKILEICKGASTLVKLLECIYVGTTATIKHSASAFETTCGYRQEGLESPSIFNIYLDFVLRCILY